MRSYTQDSAGSLSALEATSVQPSSFLNLIPPAVQHYPQEGSHFYSTAPTLFSGIDVRSRLGSNNPSGPGMAQAPRTTTLPHPGSQLTTRDIYSSATPSYRRHPEHQHHLPRSPSFPAIRRHPLSSPTPSPIAYNPLRMDAGYGNKSQQNIPPLNALVPLGHLSYNDQAQTPIKVEINGVIDKGFFLADSEWTCYRRNYFSCVCSYSISPPGHPNTTMQFLRAGEQQAYPVYGFAMCISAVVADNDNLAIELVQHTPKRDKGPIAKPEKIRLSPKPPQTSHHPINNLYAGSGGDLGSSRGYDQGFGQTQSNLSNEHTFERIQFKQATANNGKRRAAQQYYHLIVELWADTGTQGADPYVRVAYRKSAKMIVRGRSPGHYQSERRASTSSGPGGSGGGSISGAGYSSGMVGSGDYSSNPSMMTGGYAPTYDPRSYGGTRHHHDISMEPIISPDECKAITEPKGYQYYAATIYEGGEPDARGHHQVEMFPRGGGDHDNSSSTSSGTMSSGFDPAKVKPEVELPSMFYPGPSYYGNNRCGRFEGKASSAGYYPSSVPPSSTMNMT